MSLINERSVYKTYMTISDLPSAYTELEYIESTGTQYIDTGYKPNSETRVEIKCSITQHKDWEHIAYVADDNGTGYRYGIMDGYNQYKANYLRLDYCKYESDVKNKITPFLYTLNEPFIFSLYKGVTVNGTAQTATIIDTYKDTKFQLGINLYLFAGNYNNKLNGDGSTKWNTIGRMYYCKIYAETGELYYNLIPARRKSDGVVGMYDSAKNVFLTNQGAGAFTAGPEINRTDFTYTKTIVGTTNVSYKTIICKSFLPDEYKECEYIEMNGDGTSNKGQIINTGYVAGDNMIFNLTADMTVGAVGTSTGNDSKTIFAVSYGPTSRNGQMMLIYDETGYNNPTTNASWKGKHEYTIDYYNNRLGCDGTYQAMERTVTKYSNSLPFIIGAWNEGNTYHYRASGKFYQLRITNTTKKLFHGVPALRIADSVPGFYDLVSGNFYTNSGTGTLGYKVLNGDYVAPTL